MCAVFVYFTFTNIKKYILTHICNKIYVHLIKKDRYTLEYDQNGNDMNDLLELRLIEERTANTLFL